MSPNLILRANDKTLVIHSPSEVRGWSEASNSRLWITLLEADAHLLEFKSDDERTEIVRTLTKYVTNKDTVWQYQYYETPVTSPELEQVPIKELLEEAGRRLGASYVVLPGHGKETRDKLEAKGVEICGERISWAGGRALYIKLRTV